MNKLKATIVNIESSEYISLVDLRANGDIFSCMIIETAETADYLKIGNEVFILFKETEVSIGKNLSGEISLRNRLHSTVKQINKGAVLTNLLLDYKGIEIGSVITTRSANKLQLKVGDEVVGLVKANEVSIMEGETPWNSVGSR
jgi:molybdate transport system regulatory protein